MKLLAETYKKGRDDIQNYKIAWNLWNSNPSCSAKKHSSIRMGVFFDVKSMGFEQSKSQYAGGVLQPPVQKLVAAYIFVRRAKMQTNPSCSAKNPSIRMGFFFDYLTEYTS